MNKGKNLFDTLRSGGVAVIPTDTIYGIVARALDPQAIESVYKIKGRRPEKPFIILISSVNDLEKFDISSNLFQKEFFTKYWPGAVSIILDCPEKKFEYLHRGTNSLAFRLPDKKDLRSLIEKTGPLIAPSANPEGLEPAKNIVEANNYFGSKIDYYENGGSVDGISSTLVLLKKNSYEIIRQGAAKI